MQEPKKSYSTNVGSLKEEGAIDKEASQIVQEQLSVKLNGNLNFWTLNHTHTKDSLHHQSQLSIPTIQYMYCIAEIRA